MKDETKGCATSSSTDGTLTTKPNEVRYTEASNKYKIYKDWIKLNPTAPYLQFVEFYTTLGQCLEVRGRTE